ncbi:MAG: selenide, water dikinase SelD, partial [Deltaproteobacteria bacterium]|nr:selenide, water dikinase SelD [Deltaproteobacteria bacterium]
KAVTSMKTLNKKAAELMINFTVNACTDITGFGLLGHACEMIEGSDVGIEIYASEVPFFTEALEYAKMGLIPGGTYRNEDFRSGMVDIEPGLDPDLVKIFSDPQTSGGLLISMPEAEAESLLSDLHSNGIVEAAIIGRITNGHPGNIFVGK